VQCVGDFRTDKQLLEPGAGPAQSWQPMNAGDTQRAWRVEPFVLLEGGQRWLPPAMTLPTGGSHQTAAQRGGELKVLPQHSHVPFVSPFLCVPIDLPAGHHWLHVVSTMQPARLSWPLPALVSASQMSADNLCRPAGQGHAAERPAARQVRGPAAGADG
jgi:hypothetical protein